MFNLKLEKNNSKTNCQLCVCILNKNEPVYTLEIEGLQNIVFCDDCGSSLQNMLDEEYAKYYYENRL